MSTYEPNEAEAILLDSYVQNGLHESGEKDPMERLLLAIQLLEEAELLFATATENHPKPETNEETE